MDSSQYMDHKNEETIDFNMKTGEVNEFKDMLLVGKRISFPTGLEFANCWKFSGQHNYNLARLTRKPEAKKNKK